MDVQNIMLQQTLNSIIYCEADTLNKINHTNRYYNSTIKINCIMHVVSIIIPGTSVVSLHCLIGSGVQLAFFRHLDVNSLVIKLLLVHQNVTVAPSTVEL